MTGRLIDRLLASDEPSIRWKVRVHVLGEDAESRPVGRLREQVRTSPRVRRMLDGHAALAPKAYTKWQGGHWVLLALADLGYPAGDVALAPIRDEVVRTWLRPRYFSEFDRATTPGRGPQAVPVVGGRHRRCGSQQGAALLALVRLGLEGDDAEQLADRLRHWQWPDGGWNCDMRPTARSSSVHETLLPMRGLAAYATAHDDLAARDAAHRAAEVFLERRLLFRRSTGDLIRSDWAKLHHPVYWHYDLLAGLKGLAEAGRIGDDRCTDGLDVLESKQLPHGGWPAEARYYKRVGREGGSSAEYVDWGGVDRGRMNEWVTADALHALAAAGRL